MGVAAPIGDGAALLGVTCDARTTRGLVVASANLASRGPGPGAATGAEDGGDRAGSPAGDGAITGGATTGISSSAGAAWSTVPTGLDSAADLGRIACAGRRRA